MTVEYNEAGFLKNPGDWDEIIMHTIANRENIKLSVEMVDLILNCRAYYGGVMKKIAMLGGLPQPTGCI